MSAVPANPHSSFQLFKRNSNDIVKARPFNGDHLKVVTSAVSECINKHSDTIKELSKV